MNPTPKADKIKCSLRDYLAYPAVGSSALRVLINQSPAHYLWNLEHPTETTPAQAFGSAIHQAALEPKLFKEQCKVAPIFEGKTKKGEITTNPNAIEVREKRDEWYLENHGKTILTQDNFDIVQGILNSLSDHKQAAKLMSSGRAEESLFWMDPESGIHCKARPDFIRDGHILLDLKSTEDASYHSFQKDIVKFGYHIQAAMYLDAASAVFSGLYDTFIIIAVEKSPPYAVNVFQLDETAIREGQEQYYGALKTLKKCRETGIYPAYGNEITPIALPTWAIKGEF